jgi:hypothetical protein
MTELKLLWLDLVQLIVALFTGSVEKQVIYQEVQPEWWNVKPGHQVNKINDGIRY